MHKKPVRLNKSGIELALCTDAMERKNNIVLLSKLREVKKHQEADLEYQAQILSMTKLELLDEMVRFQKERSQKGELDLQMMLKGKVLFSALEKNAETEELHLLAKSYRRHLEFELKEFLKGAQKVTESV